jgi:hypothetical protein
MTAAFSAEPDLSGAGVDRGVTEQSLNLGVVTAGCRRPPGCRAVPSEPPAADSIDWATRIRTTAGVNAPGLKLLSPVAVPLWAHLPL